MSPDASTAAMKDELVQLGDVGILIRFQLSNQRGELLGSGRLRCDRRRRRRRPAGLGGGHHKINLSAAFKQSVIWRSDSPKNVTH